MRLDVVDELEGRQTGPVPLVDEGDDRQAPVAAHLEQFEGLGLDSLRGVEDHHRGVAGGEHPVGVLGEVAVPGSVQQVHHAVPVRELEHRRGDGDATLLFELHPVRGGGPAIRLGLHGSGLAAECTSVEEQLLGEGGLAGVGMRDDREGAPPSGLGGRVGCHSVHQFVERAQQGRGPRVPRESEVHLVHHVPAGETTPRVGEPDRAAGSEVAEGVGSHQR